MPELHNLSIQHLRVLDMVLRELSVSRAALLLGATQPALSKILSRLRDHFNDPLVVRAGGSLQPTPRAAELAEPLRLLIGAYERLNAASVRFEPRESRRVFKLLTTDVGMVRFLPALIARMEADGLGLRLESVPLDATRFETKLENGSADIALGAFPEAQASIKRQHLYNDIYVGVARKAHPRFRALASKNAFLRERHILIMASSTGHAAHVAATDVLRNELPPENVYLRLPSFTAGVIVVSRTDTILVLPQQLAQLIAGEFGLATFKPPMALPSIKIAQYWHERFHRDPAHRWLRQEIHALFGKRD